MSIWSYVILMYMLKLIHYDKNLYTVNGHSFPNNQYRNVHNKQTTGLVREKSWVYFFDKISIILRNFPKYGSYNLYNMEIFLTQKYQRSLKISQKYGQLKLVPDLMTWGLYQATTPSYDYLSTHSAQVNWQIIQICALTNPRLSTD